MSLTLAAGVPDAFADGDFTLVTVGYVVMRVPLVVQWLRVARDDPARRAVALRYAAGIALVQVGWLLRLALPEGWGLAGFLVLALVLLVALLPLPVAVVAAGVALGSAGAGRRGRRATGSAAGARGIARYSASADDLVAVPSRVANVGTSGRSGMREAELRPAASRCPAASPAAETGPCPSAPAGELVGPPRGCPFRRTRRRRATGPRRGP